MTTRFAKDRRWGRMLSMTALAAIALFAIAGVALAQQAPRPRTFVLYFTLASAQLTSRAQAIVAQAAADIQRTAAAGKVFHVKVIGYSDTVGTIGAAERLSRRRAEVVRDALVRAGVTAEIIKTEGRGKKQLEVPTEDQVKNPRNRRVRIILYGPGD